jgi:parallel beta-helix repeat protein
MTFRFLHWLRAAARGTARQSRPRPVVRPVLEALEDRRVPTVLQVGASEPFHTITSALQAAEPGDTIRVHPGTYQEAIDITTNDITLEGVNASAVIQAPASLASNEFALVQVKGATGVTIQGLTIEGPYNGGFTDVNGNLLGLHAGIFVADSGSATINHNHITDIRDNPPNTTSDDGYGILIGSDPNVLDTTGSALIENNTVDNYGRVGIDVANAGSSATIRNNTITGLSLTLANQYPAQIGIATETGGTAVITGNRVSQNLQTIANGFGFGMELLGPGAGITVVDNVVTDNTQGIALVSAQGPVLADNSVSGNTADGIDLVSTSGATVVANSSDNNGGNGIALFSSTDNLVLLNRARHNGGDGLYVDPASIGNTFLLNTMKHNAVFDAEDDSVGSGTAGTGNTWIDNTGKTDNVGGGLLR